MSPHVSVILPTYNSSETILEAINCIKKQTITDWELIVVDDASEDNSVEIIKQVQSDNIRLITLPVNLGYPTAMNAGIEAAKGKYIARMDSDDICSPIRLQTQLEALRLFPQASFCGLIYFEITPGGKAFIKRDISCQQYIFETWDVLMSYRKYFADPSVLVEKSKVVSVGGYRTFQRMTMDIDLWFRLMERYGPCVTVTRPLYGKRLYPDSIKFNPKTSLCKQIPRVLALQRKENGVDDIELGKTVCVEDYLQKGWIIDKVKIIHPLYRALIICMWLNDINGMWVYWNNIIEFAEPGVWSRVKLVRTILTKYLRWNDGKYKRYYWNFE
jgi:glycosyltransferase involved in cell wall biosynthesis